MLRGEGRGGCWGPPPLAEQSPPSPLRRAAPPIHPDPPSSQGTPPIPGVLGGRGGWVLVPVPQVKVVGCWEGAVFPAPHPRALQVSPSAAGWGLEGLQVLVGHAPSPNPGCPCWGRDGSLSATTPLQGPNWEGGEYCSSVGPALGAPHIGQGAGGDAAGGPGGGGSANAGDPAEGAASPPWGPMGAWKPAMLTASTLVLRGLGRGGQLHP